MAPVFLISHPNHLAALSPNLVLIFFLPCWICQDSGLDHFSLHPIFLNDVLSPMTCKTNYCQWHPQFTDVLISGWHIPARSQPLHLSTRHLTLNILKTEFFFLKMNRRIIALPCCSDFCCTSVGISSKYIYIPFWAFLPSPLSQSSRPSQSTELSSLCAESSLQPAGFL